MTGVDEPWFRDRAVALANVEPPSGPFEAASLVRRGERARRRRVAVRSAGSGVAVAAVCAAVLTGPVIGGETAPPPAAPAEVTSRPAPDVLEVTCTPRGIRVEPGVLAARDGVHVRLADSSGGRARNVWLQELGPGEEPREGNSGAPLELTQADHVLPVPPGRTAFGCGPADREPTTWQVVQVADPQGWFDPTTAADAGCAQSNVGAVDVAPGTGARDVGAGATPQEAAEDLARRLGGMPLGREVQVLGGYVDADRRTALLSQWSRRTVVADLNRSGTGWTAVEVGTCD